MTNATQAIFEDLVNGATISQLDARHYQIEDIRTPVSHLQNRLWNAGYEVKRRWVMTTTGKRIKEYWATSRNV